MHRQNGQVYISVAEERNPVQHLDYVSSCGPYREPSGRRRYCPAAPDLVLARARGGKFLNERLHVLSAHFVVDGDGSADGY